MLVVGLVVLVLSVVLLIVPAVAAGHFAAKVVGLPNYRLFDVKPKGTLSREIVIVMASAAAPLLVGVVSLFIAIVVGGESFGSNRIDVIHGSAAQLAGLLDGDRVLNIDGTATPDFDAVRAALRRSTAVHTVTIERQGRFGDVEVSPDARGTIGIVAVPEIRKASVTRALAKGLYTQWNAWKERFLPFREKVDLAGPVAIVNSIAEERSQRLLYPLHFIGVFECLFCTCIAGTFVNDWVMWGLLSLRRFKRLQIVASGRRVARMRRLHHALKFNVGFIVCLMVWVILVDLQSLMQVGSSNAHMAWHLEAWLASFESALVPIVWLICRELYSKKKAVGITLLMLVPVVNILVILWHLNAAKRWLKERSSEAAPVEAS